MTEKNLKDIQEELDAYIGQFENGYFSPLAQLARLTEEVGELAREVNHHYGEKNKKSDEPLNSVGEELGDILIATVIMANSLGLDLTEIFEENMEKFNRRDNYRFKRKDGTTYD